MASSLSTGSHTYEELREAVVKALIDPGPTRTIHQFRDLALAVAEQFERRAGTYSGPGLVREDPEDEELIREIFWDLFRQGIITLGLNISNPSWPFFRLSRSGKVTLAKQSPWRFHNTNSYLQMVRHEAPDISKETLVYLDEAVAAFYADCMLASCVMLGVAAEAEFLKLLDVARSRPSVGKYFSSAAKERFIRQKIARFLPALKTIGSQLDPQAVEDLETNFAPIQSVLRIARNDAGHPTSASPQRENVYVNLQLFVPFARQVMRLRSALRAHYPDPVGSGP